MVGFAQLLLFAPERLYLFGAGLLGMPESISLSWPESGGTIPIQAVLFWSFGAGRYGTSLGGGTVRESTDLHPHRLRYFAAGATEEADASDYV